MLSCEGYKMFLGTMKVITPNTSIASYVAGIWLYKPECDCWYCNGNSYPASVCELDKDFDNCVTEVCPHCEEEVTLSWDVNLMGYQIYCPKCGKKMLLCSECEGSHTGGCNWSSEKGCYMAPTSEDCLREEVK